MEPGACQGRGPAAREGWGPTLRGRVLAWTLGLCGGRMLGSAHQSLCEQRQGKCVVLGALRGAGAQGPDGGGAGPASGSLLGEEPIWGYLEE